MDLERFTSAVQLELGPGEWVYSKDPVWLPSEIWEDPL
jgi:hypothetical protein